MSNKLVNKSQIPVIVSKKVSSDAHKKVIGNRIQPIIVCIDKTKKTSSNKKEVVNKVKTCSNVMVTKITYDKCSQVSKSKSPVQRAGRSPIEVLSRELANQLKKEQSIDCDVRRRNASPGSTNSSSGKPFPGKAKRENPSAPVQPHSGMSFKPVKKIVTSTFAFNTKITSPPKRRRSKSFSDLKFENSKVETNRLQQKVIQKCTMHEKIKTGCTSILTKQNHGTKLGRTSSKENSVVYVRSTRVKVPKNDVPEKKLVKALLPKPRPLRRSNTIHDIDPVLKKINAFKNKSPLLKKVQEDSKVENIGPATPESLKSPHQILKNVDDIQITPKSELPHGGLRFPAARKKNLRELHELNVFK